MCWNGPATYPLSRSQEMAYAALFRAWGADYQGENECRQAEAIGLRCLTARGGLDELRQLNLPAVLLMRENQGQKFYATLVRIDRQSATFDVGTETRAVALGALADQWSGHYTLLWRMPPVVNKQLRLGDQGPDVPWPVKLRAQLHRAAAETDQDQVVDEAMMGHVKQFQFAQGLM